MKIIVAHNKYQKSGGEDAVVKSEGALLKDQGHDVCLYQKDNDEINGYSKMKALRHFYHLDWSADTYQEFKAVIKSFKPDVVHFHNIFYLITPSAYFACKEEGIPVVQSLHNFRIICPNALFYRDGVVCEKCLSGTLLHGIYNRCFRKSIVLTALMARMIKKTWKKDVWNNAVDQYITATDFTRQKYIEKGIPQEKISVKPNLMYPDTKRRRRDKGYVLYVGRLSHEKGVDVLLKAWKSIQNVPLKIIGDGPLSTSLKEYARANHLSPVEFLDYVDDSVFEEALQGAKFLVVSSRCYENFPRIVAEAFSFGIPVLASRLGSLSEIIDDQETGFLFESGHPEDLAQKAMRLINDEHQLAKMSQKARSVFEEKFSSEVNYRLLMEIYQKAIANQKQ